MRYSIVVDGDLYFNKMDVEIFTDTKGRKLHD